MKKSPYDRERFFEKYSQMDRSRLGLAGAGEWESLEPLLPDFAGKRVLDLGCGYGWHCIYAAEHGAAAVTGVDLSEKMLAVAREKTTAPQVTYIRGDMAETPFPPESFDVVLSSLALGVGVASIRSDENAAQDSFGLVALCSVGPILAVMVLALIYPGAGVYTPVEIPSVTDSRALWHLFQVELPAYLSEVAVCLAPIALFFAVFQAVSLKLKKKKVLKIVIGILYTYVGLVLFLTGANVGFMPAASYLSRQIAGLSFNWILIPIGMLMGWFIVQAEPAVHVLNKQVEEITSGAIPGKAMSTSLSIGVAVSIGLAMMRVMTGISIFWLVVPGYLAAIVMSFFVPKIFTAIAFDSGGVASGPMTATFLLPFAQGACEALGGNVVTDAFGVVAMVAMTPLLTIQMLGLLYQLKMKRAAQETPPAPVDEEIIEL